MLEYALEYAHAGVCAGVCVTKIDLTLGPRESVCNLDCELYAVGDWPWGSPRAFRYSGKDLQSESILPAWGRAIEFAPVLLFQQMVGL